MHCFRGVWAATVYCYDKIGPTGANLDLLQLVAMVLGGIVGPKILSGDFNVTREQIQDTGWPKLAGMPLYTPKVPTCH